MNLEYSTILIFIILSVILAFVILFASYLLIPKQYNIEKISSYECGFDPFEDTRSRFDVRFYLIGILFIVFDLEVIFLFPWSVALPEIGAFGFWTMIAFLGILTIGFIYEWRRGALDWE